MTFHPKLMIFDMDGTLIDAHHDFFIEQANRIFRDMSLPSCDSALMKQHIAEWRFFEILGSENTLSTRNQFWHLYNRTVWDYEHRSVEPPVARAISGAHEAIRFCIENGSEVALATARPWPVSQIKEYLEETALLNHISFISTFHEKDWHDKTPQLLEVCERFKINPAYSAKVGDLPSDVSSSYLAEIGLVVSVRTGGINQDKLLSAAKLTNASTKHLIIDDVSELKNHLFPVVSSNERSGPY